MPEISKAKCYRRKNINFKKVNLLKQKSLLWKRISAKKLHQFIDTIADKKVAAMYALFEDEIDTDARRRLLVQAERQKYLTGEGNSFNWDEVKQMATDPFKNNFTLVI